MPTTHKSSYEIKKLSDWWLDISKILLGSLVVKLFDPSGPALSIQGAIIGVAGLTIALLAVKLGLEHARKVDT